MTYPQQNGPKISPEAGGEKRQNSYEESSASKDAENAPDIQQPGAPGDFGNDSANMPKREPKSSARAPKGTGGRTPGDQHNQTGGDQVTRPKDAAEPSDPYAGT